MIAPLVALITTIASAYQQAADPLVIETLDQAVPHIFKDKTYRIEYGNDLADSPVVYTFTKSTNPSADLKNFCKALFLETEFDESTKLIKIKKSSFLIERGRKVLIAKAIEQLRDQMTPFLRSDPRQIASRRQNLLRMLTGEPDVKERDQLRSQINALDSVLVSLERALVMSVLSNENIVSILSSPFTKSNYGNVTADAVPYVKKYLAGEGVTTWDNYVSDDTSSQNLESMKQMADELREQGRRTGSLSPITILRHDSWASETVVSLLTVTPNMVRAEASLSLSHGDLLPGTVTNIPSIALNKELQDLPLWNSEVTTINSCGSMAKDLGVNFASWLTSIKSFRLGALTFAGLQKMDIGLSAKLENDWLTVFYTNAPCSLNAKCWKPFLALREILESKPMHRKILLAALDALKDSDLDRLEELGGQFRPMPQKYFILTSGVRLYRAFLRCLEGQANEPFDRKYSYDQLASQARRDFLDFFRSNFVWNNYPQLFHPVNQPKIRSAGLNVSYDPNSTSESQNFIQICFPQDWDPIGQDGARPRLTFQVDTKNMVP